MCFSRPGYLYLLWLLVPLAVLVFYGVRRKLSAWAKSTPQVEAQESCLP